MSPYVEAGYAVVLGGLGGYASLLLARERRAVARLQRSRVPVRSTPRRVTSDRPEGGIRSEESGD